MRPGEHTLSVRVPGSPAAQITGATYFDNQRRVEVKADALGNVRLYLGESFYASVRPEIVVRGSLRSGLALRIETTRACTPGENERGELPGGVTVKAGDKVLTTNAEGEAARRRKFPPATVSGQPAKMTGIIKIDFAPWPAAGRGRIRTGSKAGRPEHYDLGRSSSTRNGLNFQEG